jgi:hypothetical protein
MPLPRQQNLALRRLHAALNARATSGPGQPDTPEAAEARQLRTELEDAFGPDEFAGDPPGPPRPAGTTGGTRPARTSGASRRARPRRPSGACRRTTDHADP